jgi:hypothetical protein
MNLFKKPQMERAKALVALGMCRAAIVIATDSAAIQEDVSAISPNCDDIGLLHPKDYENDNGIYLWEGTIKQLFRQSFEGTEMDGLEYEGDLRPVEPQELTALLLLSPPCFYEETE